LDRFVDWEFKVGGVSRKVARKALHTFSDTDLVLQAVLDGHGTAQLVAYQVSGLLHEGRLHACLAQHAPDGRGRYTCYLSRQHLPAANPRVYRLHNRADPSSRSAVSYSSLLVLPSLIVLSATTP
jgi:DNA-binding transcriptional LysR family regulator